MSKHDPINPPGGKELPGKMPDNKAIMRDPNMKASMGEAPMSSLSDGVDEDDIWTGTSDLLHNKQDHPYDRGHEQNHEYMYGDGFNNDEH